MNYCFENIYTKFKKTEWLECEFTSHYTLRNAEMNLKSKTTNQFNF